LHNLFITAQMSPVTDMEKIKVLKLDIKKL